MTRLIFAGLTGNTPFDVYVSDANGNNETNLGTISASIPPNQIFSPPSIFNSLENILVILEDSNNNRYYKLLPCSYNCDFSVTIVKNSNGGVIQVQTIDA